MLTLADVLEGVGGPRVEALAGAAVHGMAIDSREVMRGDVFVAFKGERVDGHAYLGHALGRGAIAALVENDCDALMLVVAPSPTYASGYQPLTYCPPS